MYSRDNGIEMLSSSLSLLSVTMEDDKQTLEDFQSSFPMKDLRKVSYYLG